MLLHHHDPGLRTRAWPGLMSAFIPAPRARKPGLPSPRLEIPARNGEGSSSSSGSSSSTSTPSEGASSNHGIYTNSSTSTHAASRPSLRIVPLEAHSVVSLPNNVPIGFEQLSLDERTMRPGLIMSVPYHQPSSSSSSTPSLKPRLALPSRTPSSNSLNSFALDSDMMVRSTSFEGALAEKSLRVQGEDYKLSPETLEDLGRLGEGASGEVRKVRHNPSGTIMAKKVRRHQQQ